MSTQCDIGRLALRKRELQNELVEVRQEIKTLATQCELPFAVEIDGEIVTVRKGQKSYYREGPSTPAVSIVPKVDTC